MPAIRIHLEKIAKMLNPVSIKELEVLVKNFPTKAINGMGNFPGKFYQTFQEEIIQILHKFLTK